MLNKVMVHFSLGLLLYNTLFWSLLHKNGRKGATEIESVCPKNSDDAAIPQRIPAFICKYL